MAGVSTWRDGAPLPGSRWSRRSSLQWRPRRGRARRTALLIAALVVVTGAVTFVVVLLGGTHHGSSPSSRSALRGAQSTTQAPPLALGSPSQATAGALPAHANHAAGGSAQARPVAELRDPEEGRSFPVSPQQRARYHSAATPSHAADTFVSPGALSTTQVRKELTQEQAIERAEQSAQATLPGGDSVGGNGTIPIPSGVPTTIQQVIAGANEITDLPYVYGGGHASFVDNAYDCSGSVSYALAAGGLLSAPETSGELESWGAPGPGKWITVFAAGGHVYMYVNVGGAWMRYDTVGRSGPFASRWQPSARSNEGFVARHWPGL
jgi:cell wall-associated NlpC family hydrolase